MRKVVVYMLLSADGVAEAPETFFGWDDALDPVLGDVISRQDTVILGRRTFNSWSQFWPTSTIQPFAMFINAVPKYIATSTPLDREWPGATQIETDLSKFARTLKGQPGGDIGIHGSISVARALVGAGLVDELRLAIGPMIVGHGQRLLDDLPSVPLELISSESTPEGYLSVAYAVGSPKDVS